MISFKFIDPRHILKKKFFFIYLKDKKNNLLNQDLPPKMGYVAGRTELSALTARRTVKRCRSIWPLSGTLFGWEHSETEIKELSPQK